MPRLILLRNPLKPKSREIILSEVGKEPLVLVPSNFPVDSAQIIHNGNVRNGSGFLQGYRFQEEYDEIILRVIPKEPTTITAIAVTVITTAVSVGLSYAIQALVPKPKIENKKLFDNTEESPSYGWDGIQNTIRNGTLRGIVYGRHRVAGQYLSTFTRVNDDDKHVLYMLIGLCTGPVEAINGFTEDTSSANGSEIDEFGNSVEGLTGSDISSDLIINNNPATQYNDVKVFYRMGNRVQSIIPGFRDTSTQYDERIDLVYNSAQTYTTKDAIHEIELLLRFPSGLYQVDSSGAFNAHSVTFSLRYREYGTATWSPWPRVETISGKNRSFYTRTIRFENLDFARYEFEITRTTADDDAYSVSSSSLIGAVERVYDDVAHKGIALCGVKAIATDQLSGSLPQETSEVHGKRCKVYQPGDDFCEDRAQNFALDRDKHFWGWRSHNAQDNRAKIAYADAHTRTVNSLIVRHAEETSSLGEEASPTSPYFYKEIVGDFDVRVTGELIGTSSPGDGMGLLVMDPDYPANFAFVGQHNTAGTLQRRFYDSLIGADKNYLRPSGNNYYRITRSGPEWTFYTSADGSTWTEMGTATYAVANDDDKAFVGLAYYSETSDQGGLSVQFTDFTFADTTCYSEEATNCPAWVAYDIVSNDKDGIGGYLNQAKIELDTFIDFAADCNVLVDNGRGGTHRRWRFDGVFDAGGGAWDKVNRMLEMYRASLAQQGDRIRVVWQRPQTVAAQRFTPLFTRANYLKDSLNISYHSPKVDANFWEMQFRNEDNEWEQDIEPYIDPQKTATEPFRRKTTSVYGKTRRAEVRRYGFYRCKANRSMIRSLSFDTSMAAVTCEPYDVILVSIPMLGIGKGGRVIHGTERSVALDRTVELESGNTYQVQVRHADDTVETQYVTNDIGITDILLVSSWTQVPAENDVWAFGVQNILTKKFMVSRMVMASDLTCTIESVEYDEDVYDETIESLPDITYTTLPDPRDFPGDVKDLVLAERAQTMPDGTIQNVIDVTYRSGANAASYDIYYRESAGTSWFFWGNTKGLHEIVHGIFVVDTWYDIAVVSVGPWGSKKRPEPTSTPGVPMQSILTRGKIGAPDVPAWIEVRRIGDSLVITWAAVDVGDLLGYQVRYADSSDWDNAIKLIDLTEATKLVVPDFETGAKVFMVKTINTSGIESTTYASKSYTVPDRDGETTAVTRNEASNSWNGTKTNFSISGTDILQDSGTLTASYVTPDGAIDATSSDRYWVHCDIAWSEELTAYTWGNADFTWGSDIAKTITWGGAPTGGGQIIFAVVIRYADTTPITSSYESFIASGEYEARYFQFKIEVTNASAAYRAKITDMVTKVTS